MNKQFLNKPILNAKENGEPKRLAQGKSGKAGSVKAGKTNSLPATRKQSTDNGETLTTIEARINVGFGNYLSIRGEGNGLSWDRGQALTCLDGATWTWSTTRASREVVFKLLLNDQVWCRGDNIHVPAGRKVEVVPHF